MASTRPKIVLKIEPPQHPQLHHHSPLLSLPTEILTHILTYVLTPTSARLHLLTRDTLHFFYYESSLSTNNTVITTVTTTTTSTGTTTTSTLPATITDGYKSRYRLYFPSTLLVSHHLHDLTLHILHTTTTLHISLGHRLAADATLNVRHTLRVRSSSRAEYELLDAKSRRIEEARKTAQRKRIERMTRTLGMVSGWRRVVVEVDCCSVHARTLAEQVDVVLGCLQRRAVLKSVSEEYGVTNIREQLVMGSGSNYVVVDLRQWAQLTRAHFFWGRRKRVAVDLLRVLMKWRGVRAVGERLCVEVGGQYGVPIERHRGAISNGEEYVEEGEIRQFQAMTENKEVHSPKMCKMLRSFGMAFEGRMVVNGSVGYGRDGVDEGKKMILV